MRATAILGPALGAFAGGIVAALVTIAIVKPGKTEDRSSRSGAKIEAEADPDADLEETSSPLEERVARLENAVGGLARRALAPAAAGSGEPAPSGDTQVIDDPVFEAAVRDVVERLQEERVADRQLERSERRKQRAEQWSGELAGTLRLNDRQRAAVSAVAQQFYDRIREAGSSDAGRLDREARRARMAELRTQAENELGRVLDGSQLQSYRALPEEQKLGGRRGRSRGQRPE